MSFFIFLSIRKKSYIVLVNYTSYREKIKKNSVKIPKKSDPKEIGSLFGQVLRCPYHWRKKDEKEYLLILRNR